MFASGSAASSCSAASIVEPVGAVGLSGEGEQLCVLGEQLALRAVALPEREVKPHPCEQQRRAAL